MGLLNRGERHGTRSGVTLALSLAMLLASLGTSIANVALPSIAVAFGAPFHEVQAVVVAYLAALTVSVLFAGRLGDRRGLKPMLQLGLVLFAVASLLCAVAPNLWVLVAARLLQGAGAAFLMTLSMALMRQTASEDRIGRAMGLLGTVSAVGTALGPTLGGVLIPYAGWRGVFWVQLPLAVLTLALVMARLPDDPRKGARAAATLWSVLDRTLMPSLLVNVLVPAVMMASLIASPFYLALALGLNPVQVGLVMAVGPVISMASGVPSGRVVDRVGSRPVIVFGTSLLGLGAALFAFLPATLGVAGYLLAVIVLTPGYQLFQAANNTAALADVPGDRRGTVSGLLSLSRNVGLIAGASVMGGLFAYGVGTEDFAHAPPSAFDAGLRLTFLVAAGMMMAALLASLAAPRTSGRG